MGVDPEVDSWVRLSETFGGHMHRHAGQPEVRGVNVPQIVESRHGKRAHAWREVGIGPR